MIGSSKVLMRKQDRLISGCTGNLHDILEWKRSDLEWPGAQGRQQCTVWMAGMYEISKHFLWKFFAGQLAAPA